MNRIETVTVVGQGKMGAQLFFYLAEYPFRIRWICSPGADIEKLRKSWQKKTQRARDLGVLNEADFQRRTEAIISKEIRDSDDSDLVIESIPENLGMKRELFKTLDTFLPPSCILATNSSSILPASLIPSDQRKHNTIGLHFFYPVALRNLVELVVTPDTSPGTISRAKEFLGTISRFYLFQEESEAFLLNRIFLEFQMAAWEVVREGLLTPAQTDDLIRERFFPIGAFECFDSVGIDTILASIGNYIGHYADKEKYSTLTAELSRMQSEGLLGMKSGAGFYRYSEGLTGTSAASKESSSAEIANIVTVRLSSALKEAVRLLPGPTGPAREQLAYALQEYFGVTDPSIFF